MNPVNPHLVNVAARVEPALADAVARLAELGDRTVSREIRRAISAHVEREGSSSVEAFEGRGGHAVSPAAPEGRAES